MTESERDFNVRQAEADATKLGRRFVDWLVTQARQGRTIQHAFDERAGKWSFESLPTR